MNLPALFTFTVGVPVAGITGGCGCSPASGAGWALGWLALALGMTLRRRRG